MDRRELDATLQGKECSEVEDGSDDDGDDDEEEEEAVEAERKSNRLRSVEQEMNRTSSKADTESQTASDTERGYYERTGQSWQEDKQSI